MAAAVIMAVAMGLMGPSATRAAAGTTLTAVAVNMPAMARAIMTNPIMVVVTMPPASIWVASRADTVVAIVADTVVAIAVVIVMAADMVAVAAMAAAIMAAVDITADAFSVDLRENGPVSAGAFSFGGFGWLIRYPIELGDQSFRRNCSSGKSHDGATVMGPVSGRKPPNVRFG